MRILALTLLLFLAACTETFHPLDLQGTWRANKEAAAAPITGLSDEEVASLIGENLSIDKTTMSFQNRSCRYSRVEKAQQTVKEFLEFYRLNKDIKLPASVAVVDIDCAGDLAIDQMLIDQNTIWFVWYGVLFEAKRS